MFGEYWADLAGARAYGLPNPSYVRADPQSDSLQSILANPWHMVTSCEGPLQMLRVHWSCKGSLLWSTSVALSTAATMHQTMRIAERLEVAVSGFLVWDFWLLLGAKYEAKFNLAAGTATMAWQTRVNLQNVSLGLIVLLLTKEEAWLTRTYMNIL